MNHVSIVIPTFNRAGMVVRAIQSVELQSSSDWELIVIDDGSTDDTEQKVQPHLGERITYFRQSNQGSNAARNLGASKARYEYLSFLDSDDELLPDWLRSLQNILADGPTVVCCGTVRIEGNRERVFLPKSLGPIFNDVSGKFTNGACYIIRKKVFFDIGGFDILLRSGQHTELSLRLADGIKSGQYNIKSVFEPLVRIHIHDGPRIRSNSDSKFKGAYRTLTKHSGLMAADPAMKRNYAKIVTLHAYRRRNFGVAIKTFLVYCKYSIILKFKGTSGK